MNEMSHFGDPSVRADGHGPVSEVALFRDGAAANARIGEIYQRSCAIIRREFERALGGEAPDKAALARACYPYVGISIGPDDMQTDAQLSYGALFDPGHYGTTVTRPDLFGDYYTAQIGHLIANHDKPVLVGLSDRRIPLPFVVEEATAGVRRSQIHALQRDFLLPDLSRIDDAIANNTHVTPPDQPFPLALFTAERVDFSLHRLAHYTATEAEHFQRFVFFTNYQRYVDEFIEYGRRQVAEGEEYELLVEPGPVVTPNPKLTDAPASGEALKSLPQMPAYHLTRKDRQGITLINIGVGPSNAKTITDHVAVLRPHAWLMLGHCAGLRRTQRLGDYVLAHAYVREDHVLDQDLPHWVPVPPIAEVQVALQEAVSRVTGLKGQALKTSMRTGTVATTDNRNWELRFDELFQRLSQARTIAVDMESATIAGNGFRFRVPYGTLLVVSDKPIHGEIKLRGMANVVYRERISQHLEIGMEAVRILREGGVQQLHSRKLRSFDEPAFR
jgi:AMP nucleosidase